MGMYIPKKFRMIILEYLFREGVVVAVKDFKVKKHPRIFYVDPEDSERVQQPIHNLFVIKLMQSLRSRGLVKESYNWRHFYWYITNKGINHLRDYLHLPTNVNPKTLKDDQENKPKTDSKKTEIDEEDIEKQKDQETRVPQEAGRGYRY